MSHKSRERSRQKQEQWARKNGVPPVVPDARRDGILVYISDSEEVEYRPPPERMAAAEKALQAGGAKYLDTEVGCDDGEELRIYEFADGVPREEQERVLREVDEAAGVRRAG